MNSHIITTGDYKHPEDPRLGRLVHFDSRSLQFPVRSLLEATPKKVRSYTWRCLQNLDQGTEGACVGFAWSHELIARPSEVLGITDSSAYRIYKEAQNLDPWPGNNYSGTSTLAGIKAVQKWMPSKISEYRWAFNVEDIALTLSYLGPVVIGVNWYEKMMNPDSNGFLNATGIVMGGHCTLLIGVKVTKNGRIYKIHNSWGPNWGSLGTAWITEATLIKLMAEQGEACVAVKREPEKRRKSVN